MKNIPTFVLLIFLSLQTISCIAQKKTTASFLITQYTDENGLPQNSIKGITADPEGFIWLATENGLVRFDGHQFYTFSQANSSIPDNRVYMLQPNLEPARPGPNPSPLRGAGRLEAPPNRAQPAPVGREFYGVADGLQFIRIRQGTVAYDSLYSAKIKALPFMNQGLQRTYLSSGLPNYLSGDARPAHYIIPLASGEGCFYVCDRHTVTYYSHWQKTRQIPFESDRFWYFFALGETLYFFHPDGTLTQINGSGLSGQTRVENGPIQDLVSPSRSAYTIYWNPVSNQAFLYGHNKLYALQQQATGQLRTQLLVEGFDFYQHNIKTIHYDPIQQRIFLGSLTQGLFVLTPKLFETLTTKGDEMDNVFYAQIPFGSDQVVTPAGLVLGKDPVSGKRIDRRLSGVIRSTDRYSLLADHTGHLWIKQGNHLHRYDSAGRQQRWDLGDEIKQIYQAPQGGPIWIGTRTAGLYQLDPDDPLPAPERMQTGPLRHISYLMQETPEVLIIGTERGLYQLSIRSHQVHLLAGTGSLFIRSLYVPRPGEIWFTTYSHGFFLYRAGKLTHFPLDPNRYLATSHYLFEDRRGYFWIPTNKGLFQMDRQDLLRYAQETGRERPYYHYYAKDQGFLTNEFNGGGQPGIVRLKNGYVSIPSLRGLVWFRPEQLTWPTVFCTLLVDQVTANDVPQRMRGDTVYLAQEPQQVKIQLSTPHFANLTNLHLAYHLANAQATEKPFPWITIPAQRPTILFSSLASGTYTLLIRKANGFGANPYTYKTIILVVPPQWYERRWVQVFILVLVGAGFYTIMQLRFRYILRKNRQLEVLITKRTQEVYLTLSQLKESEQELNRQLHLQSRLMASITHDIQSPLQFVTNAAGQLNKLLPDNANYALRELTETIAGTTSTISSLLKELLSYTKSKVHERRKESESIPVQALVENRHEIFRSILRVKNITFINDVPGDFQVNSDSLLLGIIIHNLIDNATKHTENGHIRVYISQISGHPHLVIANTSTTMAPNIMDWFNQVETGNESVTNLLSINKSGVGLLIVKEMAALIKVRVFVEQTQTTDVHLIFSEPTYSGFTDA